MAQAVVNPPRRSQRRSFKPIRFAEVVREDGAGDDDGDNEVDVDVGLESSGSDFEEKLAKQMKKKKKKKRGGGGGYSSSEDDHEDDAEMEEELRELEDRTARNNKMSRRASMERKGRKKAEGCQKGASTSAPKGFLVPSAGTLSLSESSSGDEDDPGGARPVVTKTSASPASKRASSSRPAAAATPSCTPDSSSSTLAASQLEALASAASGEGGSLSGLPWTRISPTSSEEEDDPAGAMEEATRKFHQEVSEALAMGGEAEHLDDDDGVGEEEDVAKEKEETDASVAKGVEVTVALPEKHRGKKKSSFDVEAYVRREINRAVRETQLAAHKTHLLCLVAHVRHLSATASSTVLKAVALSVVPPAHHFGEDRLTLPRLTQLLSWFKSSVELVEESKTGDLFPRALATHLMKRFERLRASSSEDLVLMFLLVARALGWKARLVHNFVTVPIKPDGKELRAPEKKGNGEQGQTAGQGNKDIPSEVPSQSARKSSGPKSGPSTATTTAKDIRRTKHESRRTSTKDRKRRSDSPREGSSKSSRNKKSKRDPVDNPTESGETPKKRAAAKRANVKLTATAMKEAKRRSAARGKRRQSATSESSEEEEDFKPEPPGRSVGRWSKKKGPGGGSPPVSKEKKKIDYWVEVRVRGDWTCVDVVRGRAGSSAVEQVAAGATAPISYVVAANEDGSVKDVTRRYTAAVFMTQTRKKRISESWLLETLAPFRSRDVGDEAAEDGKLQKVMESLPLPTSIAAFKDHPLYALTRHLLKFESIYPPDAPTLGFVKGEAVYPRECVHTLHCRVTWLKQGRVVKVGEKPYKVTTALPKWDRVNRTVIKDQPLDVFGHWQTEIYEPPPAKDGKVPRNEYGNVELFKPWMLPKGTVHLNVPGLNRVARKLGIDCAPAMMGWELHRTGFHPVFDGFVVCEEHSDTLLDAWNVEVEEKAKRQEEKRLKRILDNWKRLVKGLLIAKKLKAKYSKK